MRMAGRAGAERDSLRLSLPKAKIVRGCRVERVPLGRFLEALAALGDFPEELARCLMPEGDPRALLQALKACDAKLLWRLLGRALQLAPGRVVGLVATLTGVPRQRLENDPAIGLCGLAELVAAWAEVNDVEGFFRQAGALAGRWRALAKPGTGCKG